MRQTRDFSSQAASNQPQTNWESVGWFTLFAMTLAIAGVSILSVVQSVQ